MREATLGTDLQDFRTAGDGVLVRAAGDGHAAAWDALVDRHARLVWSVCRQFRLPEPDAQDVSQTVWLRLLERLGSLRDPDAVAGWLATSTRNECIAVWRSSRRQVPVNPDAAFDLLGRDAEADAPPLDHDLLAAERDRALRAAVAELPAHCRDLLALLFADPPLAYEEISARLGVPRGYIGPTRARCLGKLRACPALQEYLRLESGATVAAAGPASGGAVPVTPEVGNGTTSAPRSLLGVHGRVSSSSVANQPTYRAVGKM